MKTKFNYMYAKKDFVDFYTRLAKVNKQQRRYLLFLIPLLLILATVPSLIYQQLLLALVLLGTALICFALIYYLTRTSATSITQNPDYRFLFTQYEITLREQFITFNHSYGQTRVEWNYFNQIILTHQFIVLYQHSVPFVFNKDELPSEVTFILESLIAKHYLGPLQKIND